MKDFTFKMFEKILLTFRSNDYQIIPFIDSLALTKSTQKHIVLRHDVDRFPLQTLQMARIEAKNNIKATYYFRITPSVFKTDIIQEVVSMGHEVGYHYEDLSLNNGDFQKSITHFEGSLEKLREFYPVKTICMHGSPLSKWDNKIIWNHYNYKDYGIIADTSLDVDYNKVFYITDNGRAWNNFGVSVRDKVESNFDIPIINSNHLIKMISLGHIPKQVMINAHPDTFFDFGVKWYMNYGFIETKNIAKWIIVKFGLRK